MKTNTYFLRFLLPALTCLVAAPVFASTVLYDNAVAGTSYATDAFPISSGRSVSNSFTLSEDQTVTGFNFAAWLYPNEAPASVDWAITTGVFGGTTIASGTASSLAAVYLGVDGNGGYYWMYTITVNIAAQSLAAGTYWLQLENATTNGTYIAAWDVSGGASSASLQLTGSSPEEIPSETFQILSDVPEPATLALALAGLAMLAGARRRFAGQ